LRAAAGASFSSTMIWRIEIKDKPGIFDAAGDSVLKDILDCGIRSVKEVGVVQVYMIEGAIAEADAKKIASELIVDDVVQDYAVCNEKSLPSQDQSVKVIEIAYNPGVMDPVEESTLKGIRDLGIDTVTAVRTSRKHLVHGNPTDTELEFITNKVLMNKLIQHAVKDPKSQFKSLSLGSQHRKVDLIQVDLLGADDKKLAKISQEGQLFLNLNEMKAIQNHYKKLDRNPTDVELETVAQTWSEHCRHKTFRGNIRLKTTENGKTKTKVINNLLKSTIIKATQELNKSWCVSVFHDNAGVIKFDKDYNVCFKVETHNHPSALEPFGGANTGVGGVIRDTLGTGLAAKPICNTDVFCFAPPDIAFDNLPTGTLHPKRVMKGVVSGVRDYGNKMGIPTVNGAILFDKHFIGNPLVFCGNVGLIPKGKEKKAVRKGDLVVVVGGKTGRDGIHGATFSSGELTSESETVSSGAVQIGNPIEEKKVCDALMQARDQNLYSAITDCGAGGLSSAVGEMGETLGARVDLEKVPLKYQGLRYTEIWISESQERMVMAVPQEKIEKLLGVFRSENVEATVIGEFPGTGRLELFYDGCQVADLDMKFLHDGVPNITKEAEWKAPKLSAEKLNSAKDLTPALEAALGHYNVCSKEAIVRRYDHEVQGTSVIKPFMGAHWDGPMDASVLRPRWGTDRGIAVSNGINIRFGMIDPFWMAASCIDEAIRQIISVGGNLKQIALLDNFCWGNPDKPDRLGGLVRTAEGCYKAAVAFGTPFISGKDSLYNEYTENGKSIAIPGTILISAIGIVDDVNKCVTSDLKAAGNLIYIVGRTFDELGGSIYLDLNGQLGQNTPKVDFAKAVKTYDALSGAVAKGLVRAIHDCSEGGLAVTVAEMAFAGDLGAAIDLTNVPYQGSRKRDDVILFSESNSRFVVEVEPKNKKRFESAMGKNICAQIGTVESSRQLMANGLNGQTCVRADIRHLKDIWKKPLSF
jgi:phosphoribosylformylglycinamidine synthase II